MPTIPSPARSSASRFIWLAVAIVAAIIAWTVAWHVIAARIEAQAVQFVDAIAENGARAQCANPVVRGYPFRFGLFCDHLSYSNPALQTRVEAGALRSAAQFYRPNHIVSELDGPVALELPSVSGRIDWQGMQMSTRASSNGLQRGSVEARELSVEVSGKGLGAGAPGPLTLTADRFTAHIRQNGNDVDIAAYGEAIEGRLFGPLKARSMAIETTLPDQPKLLEAPVMWPQGAFDVRVHRATIELDETASLDLAGPLRVAANGLISAELQLTVRDAGQLAAVVTSYDAQAGEVIGRFAPMLGALDTVPGDDAVTVPLTIRDGAVSIGIIPLGRLAPLLR